MGKRVMVSKGNIFRSLLLRLGLGAVVHQLMLGDVVQPVVGVDEDLEVMVHEVLDNNVDGSSTGVKLVYTVPDGFKVKLKAIRVERTGSNALVNGLYFECHNEGSVNYVKLFYSWTASAGANLGPENLKQSCDMWLFEGDKLYVNVSTLYAAETFQVCAALLKRVYKRFEVM